jgi:methionyl-tRNA formyltransferase
VCRRRAVGFTPYDAEPVIGSSVRLVYLGTPDAAVPPLEALVRAGHDVALVVTQPDRRRSRGAGSDPSPVRVAADALGLEVRTPVKAREVVDDVRASGATLGVVVAFGQLLPVPLLEALPSGFVNVHFSLLPRWRGAAPVERALLAGDTETGVCVMQLEAGLDTGPVYATRTVPIDARDTAGDLRARLVEVGTRLLVEQVPRIASEQPVPQVGEPTYAEKLTVDEFRLDPERPAIELDRVVRAGNPRPGAWMRVAGRRVKVWRAHPEPDVDLSLDRASSLEPGSITPASGLVTGSGVLVLEEVQAEGKRAMAASAWRTGVPADVGLDAQ